MPHKHIRVYRGTACNQPYISGPNTVYYGHIGTVRSTEHIAVFSHKRSDIGLSEFDHNIRVDTFQTCQHIGHQYIDRYIYRGNIPAICKGKIGMLIGSKPPQEVQFKTIQSPGIQCVFIGLNNELSYFRISGIKHIGSLAVPVSQVFSFEALEIVRLLSHKGERIPEYEFHIQFMNIINKFLHFRNTQRLPVARICIAPLTVHGLPAIIHYDGRHPQFPRTL